MFEIVKTLGIGILVFVSTNIDDILILLVFFSDPLFKARQVILGQLIGMSCLIVLSLIGYLASFAIPQAWLGLLGLGPLLMGIYRLLNQDPSSSADDCTVKSTPHFGSKIFVVASVTISNGGDNLGIYLPLFAASSFERLVMLIILFFLMTGLWCWIGYKAIHHPYIGTKIKRVLNPLFPWVLIGLGLWIVFESNTIGLLTNK